MSVGVIHKTRFTLEARVSTGAYQFAPAKHAGPLGEIVARVKAYRILGLWVAPELGFRISPSTSIMAMELSVEARRRSAIAARLMGEKIR